MVIGRYCGVVIGRSIDRLVSTPAVRDRDWLLITRSVVLMICDKLFG